MANAAAAVESPTVDYDDTIVTRDIDAAQTKIWQGSMVAVDASGMEVKAQDTAGLQFDGISMETVTIDAGGSDGDFKVKVKRPFRFAMKIAAAVASDIGRPVYVLYDNEVAYSGTSASILVGWVDEILSATQVLIRPIYAGIRGDSSFDGETLTFTGATSVNQIIVPDNLALGLQIMEGSNPYLSFVTTNSAERVLVSKQMKFIDSIKLSFGDADDITMAWDGTDFDVLQAAANSSIKWGIDGAGIDHVFYGDTASAAMTWDQSADKLIFSGVAKIQLQTIVAADAAAIPVTHSGSLPITQNGAETNTLAIPTYLGQTISIFVDTDTSGARVITSAQRINQTGNTVITLTEVGDFIKLEAITIGGALRWQVVANDGADLS